MGGEAAIVGALFSRFGGLELDFSCVVWNEHRLARTFRVGVLDRAQRRRGAEARSGEAVSSGGVCERRVGLRLHQGSAVGEMVAVSSKVKVVPSSRRQVVVGGEGANDGGEGARPVGHRVPGCSAARRRG